jgi:Lrp/AsnC family transcriptional regulator, regulator for asnA, asnC and gidA
MNVRTGSFFLVKEEIQERVPGDFDQSEVKIIRLLQRNGRMSTAELARETGTSEPTVRRKLARLIDDGIITIRAVSDPVALGYAAPAYIGLDVERHRIEEVAQTLSSYPMIETVAVITGPYDILVKAAFHSTTELYDFVLKELAKVKGIKDSHSFLVLRNFKHEGLTSVAERVPKKLERPATGP